VQAWGVLEAGEGNVQLARQLFRCAVKANPASEASWLVSTLHAKMGRALARITSHCAILRLLSDCTLWKESLWGSD